MAIEWTGQFGWATLASLATLGFAVFAAIKGIGIREADLKNIGLRHKNLEDDMAKLESGMAELRRDREAFVTAVNAGVAIYRDELSDLKREIAVNYPTKGDLKSVEDRTSQGFERVFKTLDRIDSKLDAMASGRRS